MKIPMYMTKKEAIDYMTKKRRIEDDIMIIWADREELFVICTLHAHQCFDGYSIIEREVGESYADFLKRVLPYATTLTVVILNQDEIKK